MANKTIEAILRLSAKLGSVKAFATMGRKMEEVEKKAERYNRAQRRIERGARAMHGAMLRFAAPTALAYGAGRAFTEYAGVERRLNRIAINAGQSKDAVDDMLRVVNETSHDYAMAQDDIATGLESLVAAGRSAEEAMAFLPSVAATAQAAGANVGDIATTADAVGNSFDISADKMQHAFDILVAGGKQGKFELRDMAQYLPSLAPAFAALGYKGEQGLKKLTAILQTVRIRTGSAGEAATAVQNIFQKMESTETVKKFAKFGIDLRKELARARKEGRDLVDTFIDLAERATGGDLSKIPQLFTDAQFQIGMRALIQGRDAMEGFQKSLSKVDGSTLKDLNQVLSDSQAKVDRLSSSWDRFMTNVGSGISDLAVPVLEGANQAMPKAQAINSRLEKKGLGFWERRMWWARHGFDQAAQDNAAWRGGYRSPDDRRAIDAYGAYAASRNAAGPKPAASAPILLPPASVSTPSGYRPFSAGASPREAERASMQALRGDPRGVADALDAALASGGQKAGQSIEEAARKVNEAGGAAGTTFERMLEGAADRFGRAAAASFNANIRTGGPAAPGRSASGRDTGLSMPNAGQ